MLDRALGGGLVGKDPGSLQWKEKCPFPNLGGNSKLNKTEQCWQEWKEKSWKLLRGDNSQKTPAKTSLLNMRGSPWKAGMVSLGAVAVRELGGAGLD